MFNITINQDLYKIVNNKKVVIVGPAPYLINSNLGKEIDNFDIVIRINEVIPKINLRKDYGSRTDIVVHNCSKASIPDFKEKIFNDLDCFKKVKLCIIPTIKSEHSDIDYLRWPNDYISNVVRNFKTCNYSNIPFYWIGVKDYKTLYYNVNTELNSGLLAIMILLCYPVKELSIRGFTFWLGGTKYNDIYIDGHSRNIKNHIYGMSSGHGLEANKKQLFFFKSLLKKNKNLLIDNNLRILLGLKELK